MDELEELELLELESIEDASVVTDTEPEVRPDSMRAPQSLGANLEVLGDTMWESMLKMAGDYSRGIQNLVAPFREDTDRIHAAWPARQPGVEHDPLTQLEPAGFRPELGNGSNVLVAEDLRK